MDEFMVDQHGTIYMKGVVEPTTRAGFYGSVAKTWPKSQESLIDAMSDCEPLAWTVHSLYTESRDALQERARIDTDADLHIRLENMPEDTEEDAAEATRDVGLSVRFKRCR